MPMRATRLRVVLLLTTALTAPLAAQRQLPPSGDCGAIYTAGEKRLAVPHHIYTSQTQDGTTRTGEIISMLDAQYLLIQGQWMRHPLSVSADEALQQHRERFSSATTYTCKQLRRESVNGVAAVV